MSSKLYGSITFNYDTVVLPLEDAHKIQVLLAQAQKIDTIWRSGRGNIDVVRDYTPPAVSIQTVFPVQDARGIPSKVFDQWKDSVTDSSAGEEYMGIKEFYELSK